MIHIENDDDGFALIERENSMKGQPYNWEADAIKAAIRMEREACAKVCEDIGRAEEMQAIGNDYAEAIRARGQA